jgi:hypothetical protein
MQHTQPEDTVMASLAQLSDAAHSPAESASRLYGWLKSVGQRIAMCASTCADYYAAAVLYDQLRGLSDAELQRRGLSRDTLARDVGNSCDRTACR